MITEVYHPWVLLWIGKKQKPRMKLVNSDILTDNLVSIKNMIVVIVGHIYNYFNIHNYCLIPFMGFHLLTLCTEYYSLHLNLNSNCESQAWWLRHKPHIWTRSNYFSVKINTMSNFKYTTTTQLQQHRSQKGKKTVVENCFCIWWWIGNLSFMGKVFLCNPFGIVIHQYHHVMSLSIVEQFVKMYFILNIQLKY